jgi:hypothetical protein
MVSHAFYNDSNFQNWMQAVDRAVSARLGVSTLDLADMAYRDWYDDGLAPAEAAAEVIAATSDEFGLDLD